MESGFESIKTVKTLKAMTERNIYKICSKSEWAAAQAAGVYEGSELDLKDGFIHFSTAAQSRSTAAKYFAWQLDLLLIEIDAAVLGDEIKWEAAREGQLFPHLYSALPLSAVSAVHDLPLDDQGAHVFPMEFGVETP